ncbi:phage major capsid protein [Aeromonas hydrophila]|uniref:phage major capsid protein n=1 Tax=Aeromonas hydrophila TaxID=644 RepID=UPI0002F3308E|nr:phage major capsid protein [Aeromonas hydrophila]
MDIQVKKALEALAQKARKQDEEIVELREELAAAQETLEGTEDVQTVVAPLSEAVEAIQEQLEAILDEEAKGLRKLSSGNGAGVKFTEVARQMKSAIQSAAKAGLRGDLKSIFSTQSAGNAPLYVQGWEAEIIRKLIDMSPILQHAGVREVESTRSLRKRVQVTKTGARVGVENITNAMLTDTGAGSFEWVDAGFTKIESFQVITPEAIREGDFDVIDLAGDVQEIFGIKAARAALFGQGEMKGLFSFFGNDEVDATRAYNKYQTLEIPAKFGQDYKVTVAFLQKVKRSLATPYRAGSVWYMNEETFDMLAALVDPAGRPLVQDLMVEGFEGKMLGYNVVIDYTMPSLSDTGAIPFMFGSFERACTFFRVEGEHKYDQLAAFGGNHHIYDSVNFGMRIEDACALKGARVAGAKS